MIPIRNLPTDTELEEYLVPQAELNERFGKIIAKLRTLIESLGEADLKSIDYLKSCYSMNNCTDIDYDSFALPFAKEYFMQNFLKLINVFQSQKFSIGTHVVDAGSGPGASALAYVTILDLLSEGERRHLDLTLIDRSRAQLDLAQRVIESLKSEFINVELNCNFLLSDLLDWKTVESSQDLIILSHVLNENQDSSIAILEKAITSISDSGKIFVVEREGDPIWSNLDRIVPNFAIPYFKRTSIGNKSLKRLLPYQNLISTFILINLPERKLLTTLVRTYFEAWREKSEDRLDLIFEGDALYYFKSTEQPLNGLPEIKKYWRANVIPQKNIQINLLNTAYSMSSAFAEWAVKFELASEIVDLNGILILSVEPQNPLANELREYYSSRRTKR